MARVTSTMVGAVTIPVIVVIIAGEALIITSNFLFVR
jgi:hypothetical protein